MTGYRSYSSGCRLTILRLKSFSPSYPLPTTSYSPYDVVYCDGCGRYLGKVHIDTADMADEIQAKVNKVILDHRKFCKFYGENMVKPKRGFMARMGLTK